MKKIICFILVILLAIPTLSYADDFTILSNNMRVFSYKIMGNGLLDLDKDTTREQLATIAIRLKGADSLSKYEKSNVFTDVSGWSTSYINLAYSLDLMKGTTETTFNPSGKVRYVELLTVIMRALDYKDGIDFFKFPNDYYSKALEIGLADMYIPYDTIVTRGLMAETINRALDLNIKNSTLILLDLQN